MLQLFVWFIIYYINYFYSIKQSIFLNSMLKYNFLLSTKIQIIFFFQQGNYIFNLNAKNNLLN